MLSCTKYFCAVLIIGAFAFSASLETSTLSSHTEKQAGQYSTTEKKNLEEKVESQNVQESSLVFIPSFNRRTRRSIKTNPNSEEKPETLHLNKGKNRRSADDSTTPSSYPSTTEQNEELKDALNLDSKKQNRKNDEKANSETTTRKNHVIKNSSESESESEEESGLVFIPSFGRRARRAASSSDSTPVTTDFEENTSNEEALRVNNRTDNHH